MRKNKNSVLLREEEADRMRHVRAEIGRRLREQYGAPPMPDRLADLARQIEQSASECQPEHLGIRDGP